MNRLAVAAWIVGTVLVVALAITRLIAFGPEQATPFDGILLVWGAMAVFFGVLLAWRMATRRGRV